MEALSAFSLEGKTAAITGAASGIGRATAVAFASAGANVVLGDIAEDTLGAATQSAVEAGGKAVSRRCDVTRKEDLDALADRAVSEFGRLDVMCNVAGIAADGLLAEAGEAEVDKAIAVNLKGVLFGCQAAVRVMAPQGSGSIINVSSAAIDAPTARYGIYAMTKAAVAMLTKTLAVEAGRDGIRVNAIAPGTTLTNFTMRHMYRSDGTVDEARVEGFLERMKKQSPLGVIGDESDQANLMLYLASDASRWCTGQIWRANGGQTFSW